MKLKVPAGPAAAAVGVTGRALALTWSWRMRDRPGGADGAVAEGPGDCHESPAVAATERAPDRDGGGAWRDVRPPVALEPAVHAAWHEHLLPLALLHRGQGVVALVSRHRDGEILDGVLRGLGYRTARGSSTRGGGPGLQRMIEAGRRGAPLALTPDGPRGPARECKPGAVRAAVETGLPVVPLAAAATSYRRLASWDRFLVPAPGATIYVARGAPLRMRSGEPDRAERRAERVGEALEAERRAAERAAEERA